MALEKNKVHHIFCAADTSIDTWQDNLKNALMNILIEEGWIQKEGEDFYSYPKDNSIKIKLSGGTMNTSNICFLIRSYSSDGRYIEQRSFEMTPTPTGKQAGLFLNYIINSNGEIGIGLSSLGEFAYQDNFFFLIGLDEKNTAGVFIFPRQNHTTYSFMSQGEGITSASGRVNGGFKLDTIIPYPHNNSNTILYKCINYVTGETFNNVYGFYATPYSNQTLCSSVFFIERNYYKAIGNMSYNKWESFDNWGNPNKQPSDLGIGSSTKCLKLV